MAALPAPFREVLVLREIHELSYKAIAVEVGTDDTLLASNERLDATLTAFGVTHIYDEYVGDHTNKVYERIEKNVLPFFSKNLSFEARSTTPTRH